MAAKVKISLEIREQLNKVRDAYYDELKDVLKNEILDSARSGKSLVKGQGRFKQYSKSYKDQIQGKVSFRTFKVGGKKQVIPLKQLEEDRIKFEDKRVRTVNLNLSGKMLEALKIIVKNRGNKVLNIFFDENLEHGDIAKYHHGKGRVDRFLIPSAKGQLWSIALTRRLRILLENTVKRIMK